MITNHCFLEKLFPWYILLNTWVFLRQDEGYQNLLGARQEKNVLKQQEAKTNLLLFSSHN